MFSPNAFLIEAALPFVMCATVINNNGDCPGVFFVNSAEPSGACCVGGTLSLYLSTYGGWPICTGPVTTHTTFTPLSCATVIPSDSDYSSHVSEASASLSASGTNIRTTVNPDGSGGASAGPSATQNFTATAASATASQTGAAMPGHGTGSDLMVAGVGMVMAIGLGGAALWL
ncbi:hypothetical protein BDV96DRAFT_317968 [Lophiotrema nucula]|uniref:Uncharacterized protein n=1 Tax=Lophiotrema nucula TaxID=690887 RepID=A0A6A5ZKD8_9PLEO|nr:hypothetical protein BDV96DRAFT_317968 [Lophiotrema nucula]